MSDRLDKAPRPPCSQEHHRVGSSGPPSTRGVLPTDDAAELLRKIEGHLAAMRNGYRTVHADWLTVDQVAEYMSTSRDTVERLIASGQLKASEFNTSKGSGCRHRHLVHRDWVEEFLRGNIRQHAPSSRRRRRFSGGDLPRRDFIG